MKRGELFGFYNRIINKFNILLLFKGALSQEILIEMGDLINNHASDFPDKIRRCFSVFVEMAQNIMNYSAEREQIEGREFGVGIILFMEEPEYYSILAGNKIDKTRIKEITDRLELINKSDELELKKMYKTQRRMPREDDSKGAGLGLIDIARKSTDGIEYTFDDIDSETTFMELTVKIKKGE